MKKCKGTLIKTWLLMSLLLGSFSISVAAQPDDLAIVIDATHLNSTEIEVKQSLIYAALHYQWDITEHTRNSMFWKYKRSELKIDIAGPVIKIFNDEDAEIGEKWLARIKKLTLRRLAYHAEVRKARSFIN